MTKVLASWVRYFDLHTPLIAAEIGEELIKMKDVALTEAARIAVSVNSKHREVQRLGRTAKEIAAEIGEELIKVRENKPEGGLRKWVEEHCDFERRHAYRYINVYEVSVSHGTHFEQANSIREVLGLKEKPKEAPKQTRSATLDDLRKVERLRAPIKDQLSRPTYGTL